MKNNHVSLNPSYPTWWRRGFRVRTAVTQLSLLDNGNPGRTQSLSLFVPRMSNFLRHRHGLRAKIQLELWVPISQCFSKGNIVSTMYWDEWNVTRWLGMKLSRQRKQYILGLWGWGKVQYVQKWLFIRMLEHRTSGRERWGNKGSWGKFMKDL